jgi:hypothetical protein
MRTQLILTSLLLLLVSICLPSIGQRKGATKLAEAEESSFEMPTPKLCVKTHKEPKSKPQPTTSSDRKVAVDVRNEDLLAPVNNSLETLSPNSLLLVLNIDREHASLDSSFQKAVPFRAFNTETPRTHGIALRDAQGLVLHVNGIDTSDLCLASGPGHQSDHSFGHVVVSHATTALVRVPALKAAIRAEIFQITPGEMPRVIGAFPLTPSTAEEDEQ